MTIYALSTGPGVAGVAIIRISGPEAPEIIKKLTNKELKLEHNNDEWEFEKM